MEKYLKWPIEASMGGAVKGFRWQQPGSNLCLDFHGNPVTAQLVVYSDGNHHMALEACCQAFVQSNPDVLNIFYATTPPNVILQSVFQGGLMLGNLQIKVQPNVFISPGNIVDQLVNKGLMAKHTAFARSRGNVLLVKKGNPKNITGIPDLLRADITLTLSNPLTEKASYEVYKQTLLDMAEELGMDITAMRSLISKDSDRVVFGESIHHREVPQTIFSGRADVAMVYYHLALRYTRIFPDDFELIELESKTNVCTDYHIGLINDGGEWGQGFYEFMVSKKAGELYEFHGLNHI